MKMERIRKVLLWLGIATGVYALIGFFVVPSVVKSQSIQVVERELGHKLELADVRFNPFTLAAELTGFDLKEPAGSSLVSFRRLFINFQASSLFRRAWTFAALEVDAPAVRFELRPDGSHNFSALLARLRKTPPPPDEPMARLEIDRIQITDGRIDVADLQAGPDAKLALHPITFELTELSTLPAETSPYRLTARSTDGEIIQWGGEITLNPFSSTGKLALQNWKIATVDRLLGNRIGLKSAAGQLSVALDYRAAFSHGQPGLQLSNATLAIEGLSLAAAEGSAPLVSAQRFAVTGGAFDLAQRTIAVEKIELAKASASLDIDPQGTPNWTALVLQPVGASPPSAAAPAEGTAAPAADAVSPKTADTARWSVKLGQFAAAEVDVAFADRRAATATSFKATQGRATLAATAQVGPSGIAASIENLAVGASDLSLSRSSQKLGLGSLELSSTKLALTPNERGNQVEGEQLKLAVKALTGQDGARAARIDAIDLGVQAATLGMPAEADGTTTGQMVSPSVDIRGIGARTDPRRELVEIRSLRAAAKQASFEAAANLQMQSEAVRATIEHFLVRDPGSQGDLAKIGRVELAGGIVSTAQQKLSADSLVITEVDAAAAYAPDGKLDWDALLAAFAPAPAGSKSAPGTPQQNSKPARTNAWDASVKLFEIGKLRAAYRDMRQQPPLAVGVQDVNVKVRNAGTQAKAPAMLELAGSIREGGQFRAAGSLDLQTLAADLKLKVDGVSLAPAQPFIAQHARLKLVSAVASAEGRLRYAKPKEAGAEIVYEGNAGLDKVVIEETEPAQPFLSLDALRANQMRLALGPDSLDIPDLRLNRLITKLLIAEDQSVNLLKVLRPAAKDAPPAPTPATAPAGAAKPATEDSEPAFPVSLARIRIDNSVLEFADLSLRPQLFTTRMHELQGVITGVSTSRESRARLELDARVDEFGAAIIRGAMNPFKPRAFTEVDLDFRNISMTNLTPYSSKFAGYRIASGTLTMNLQYRVRNSALQGNNKIVLDKLELGERVESPTALNLPLELAIAILKDSDGRIDIGLPVTGSLDDPQFSIGGLVWKAIGNLLTRIVTAPFRALASLFGGSDSDTLGAIEFDPGSDALRPPERQKLRTVAEALQKRPQLKLTVKPSYAAAADRDALKSLAVRRAVLAKAGIKLEPGEAPGPLDVGNPRMQSALDALFVERFGTPTARDLRASLAKPPPSAQPTAEGAKPPANPGALQAIRVARAMSDRLIESAAVGDAELSDLAKRRGTAVLVELRDVAKVDPARLGAAEPKAVEPKDGPVITDLDLSASK